METYADIKDDRWSKPYAVGLFPLDQIENILGDKINSSEPCDTETLQKLNNEAKTFTGTDCITQMFKYLGQQKDLEKVTLIAHNGKTFDNWILLQEKGITPFQILKTGQGIVNMKIRNWHTSEENRELYKNKFKERKNMKKEPTGTFLQTITLRCSFKM